MNKTERSAYIKKKLIDSGFSECGISKAEFLQEEAAPLENWLKNNLQGQMKYMENHFEKRLNPSLLVENSKSVISVMYNYFPSEEQNKKSYKISKYAYGEDYHQVIKDKLFLLVEELKLTLGDFNYRIFTDSAPVLERSWAKKSGLGWIGKNAMLITKQKGSYFFLAEIICDLELEYDFQMQTNHCGTCNRCIEACPTQAILAPQKIDSNKCISYLTIELKDAIGEEFRGKMKDWVFGCDVCQEVCPWNRFSIPNSEAKFTISEEWKDFSKEEWQALSEEQFQKMFKKSPLKRTKFTGLQRNIFMNLPDNPE